MTGVLPRVLFASSDVVGYFQILDHHFMCNIISPALNRHYGVSTTKGASLSVRTGLSASSLYHRGRHLLCGMSRTS